MNSAIPNQKFRLRVTFSKTKNVAMLSHLEVARALEKTVRRSGLNYCVSQGFSPHMRVSFGRAISVGVSSENEIFDVYLKDYVSPDKALQKLKDASCNDLPVLDAKYVDNSEPAASTCYIESKYLVRVTGFVKDVLVPTEINVFKKNKTKTLSVEQYLCGQVGIVSHGEFSDISFAMKIIEGSSIKPDIFVNSMLELGGNMSSQIVSINKKNILNF